MCYLLAFSTAGQADMHELLELTCCNRATHAKTCGTCTRNTGATWVTGRNPLAAGLYKHLMSPDYDTGSRPVSSCHTMLCFCRIKLPKGGVGRDYVLIQLTINGAGPYDFMLDSGKDRRACDIQHSQCSTNAHPRLRNILQQPGGQFASSMWTIRTAGLQTLEATRGVLRRPNRCHSLCRCGLR